MAMTGGTATLVKTSKLGDSSATCKLYVYHKSTQDVANNRSTVSVGMYIVVSSGYNIGSWSDTYGSYIGTTSLTFNGAIPSGTSGTRWLVENKTFTVNHAADGTGSATINWKWGVYSTWGNMLAPSGSFKITLPTIARRSSVSATNAYIGNKPTITITRQSSSFTHTLQYKISGQSDYTTIVSKTKSTSYKDWAIPESAYNYISSGKVSITIRCKTWNGDTHIGNTTTTLTATAKAASTVSATDEYIENKPTISITRNSSNFKHTLQYKLPGDSDYTTIVSKTTSTSYKDWAIPVGCYKKTSSGKATITIRCITYYGDVNLGNTTTTLTASHKGASSIAATGANIGSKPTFTISSYSSNFKHTIQYKTSGQSSYTTIVSKTGSTSYSSWAIPADETYKLVAKDSKTISITINCITYYDTVKIGEKTTTLTASCVESVCKPTLNPSVYDTGSTSIKLTGDAQNIVIKDFNAMKYSIGASAFEKAEIASQSIACGGKTSTSASGSLGYVNSNVFTFTATDTRGYSTTATITKPTLIDFVKLTCNPEITAKLATDDAGNSSTTLTMKASGSWFNGSFGAVNNTLTVEYRYKINDGNYTAWTPITPTVNGNKYSATQTFTGLNYQNTYTAQVRAYDELFNNGDASVGLKTSAEITVSAKPVFDWGKEDFNFNVPVKMPNSDYYSISSQEGGGLDMNNSDIVKANGIYFSDASNSVGEGLMFPTDDTSGNWDSLRAVGGDLLFTPKYPEKNVAMNLTNNKVLWEGCYYMYEGQVANLKDTVSNQPHGIVLLWQYYSGGVAKNSNFTYQFIPKYHVAAFEGVGVWHDCAATGICKYVYIYDNRITGFNENNLTTTRNNVSYSNGSYVLTKVIGV